MSLPQVVVNPPAPCLGVRNAILWGTGTQYYMPDFPGPLSIKTVVRGSAHWSTHDADRLVDENSYLVLNSGQTYTLTIDSRKPVETFCLFFRQGFAEDVCRVERSGPASLLDDPLADTAGYSRGAAGTCNLEPNRARTRSEFFETLHAHDSIVSPLIRDLYVRLKDKTASGPWFEDKFLEVAVGLCRIHGEQGKRAAMIPAKKHATRVELYRRLLRGKDYMDSFSDCRAPLEEVSKQACLSPYHFHRLFREVFRETPNRYLQRKRLSNARRLLQRGERSITSICLDVGFESVTSFSGLFRRHFGCSPREYRSRKNAAQ